RSPSHGLGDVYKRQEEISNPLYFYAENCTPVIKQYRILTILLRYCPGRKSRYRRLILPGDPALNLPSHNAAVGNFSPFRQKAKKKQKIKVPPKKKNLDLMRLTGPFCGTYRN
uniref:hypothetical protein n=2 Tax=Enterocloster clostridioformis TaxID=1531 RepID=UPI0026E466C1